MRSMAGHYKHAEAPIALTIKPCGYCLAIEFANDNKTPFTGVAGASGHLLELFAHVGIASIVRLVGEVRSATELEFVAVDFPVKVLIHKGPDSVQFTLFFEAEERFSYLLIADHS